MPAPRLVLAGETACPVCGLNGAFMERGWYDTCPRCGWVDDGVRAADRLSEVSVVNGMSVSEARASWPQRAASLLASGPVATLAMTAEAPASRAYPEYAIDGNALGWGSGKATPFAFPFGAREHVEELLLERPASTWSGRVALYVCRECGDYDCGFVSAEIVRAGDRIMWVAIGRETLAYEATETVHELTPLRGPAGYAFDARQYRDALLGALKTRAARRLFRRRLPWRRR